MCVPGVVIRRRPDRFGPEDVIRGIEAMNPDGSVDLYFGPPGSAPPGKEKNWLETIPGKNWFGTLRLYGPTEPWFNQTWRPGEIEEVK
jgi:hypothetical protein